ncbi:MAG: hypothetical protein R2698_12715 [Microthrixaceae bacterium]
MNVRGDYDAGVLGGPRSNPVGVLAAVHDPNAGRLHNVVIALLVLAAVLTLVTILLWWLTRPRRPSDFTEREEANTSDLSRPATDGTTGTDGNTRTDGDTDAAAHADRLEQAAAWRVSELGPGAVLPTTPRPSDFELPTSPAGDDVASLANALAAIPDMAPGRVDFGDPPVERAVRRRRSPERPGREDGSPGSESGGPVASDGGGVPGHGAPAEQASEAGPVHDGNVEP